MYNIVGLTPLQTCMKKWSKYDVERAAEASGHVTAVEENGEDVATTYQTIARYTSEPAYTCNLCCNHRLSKVNTGEQG